MSTTLNITDFLAISPLLILLFGALILILLESFWVGASKKGGTTIAFITFLIALLAAAWAPASHSPLLTNWLQFDPLARFFALLFLAVGIGSVLLSEPFIERFNISCGEFLFLILSATAGLLLISSAADFLTLFIGFETLSIALYVLCGFIKRWLNTREASTKYFLLGALSSGFLLYGIALIYGAVGTTKFADLITGYHAIETASDKFLFLGGAAFVTMGLAFKAAIVPLHTWAPDVYDGSPTPVTAFMAVATKIGAFAAFIRVFMLALPQFSPIWNQSIAILVYPTLIYANFVAMRQIQLRRFFAYSGIAHAGFLLIPLAVGGNDALSALLFYLVIYALATLCCFAVMAFLDKRESGVFIHDLHGLYTRSPMLAIILSIALLTLAGIPPSIGFIAKFYVFKVAFQAGYYGLVIVGLLTTILSAYYYLRIVALMFAKAPSEEEKPIHSLPALSVATFCIAALLLLSIYPQPFLDLIGTVDKFKA